MSVGWRDFAFVPDKELGGEIVAAWHWLVGGSNWTPFLCSKLGDVFFEWPDGTVGWLSCAAGSVEGVAPDRASFDEVCRKSGDEVTLWFGPSLIRALHGAGKVPVDGQCYLFITLPIFAECRYSEDNFAVVPVREVFVGVSDVHQQIAELPDGAKVQIKVVD
ncbi:MAG TPA: hypothetical protein VF418_08830 [Sphingomonadaceae bacterium]